MEKGLTIFRNSKKSINEGTGDGKGILYCGEIFTNEGGCPCHSCDGHCGPDNGCACPNCYYTLSYILYMTGKMICPYCHKTLIRIYIYNLQLLKESNINYYCSKCHKNYYDKIYIPLMHCMKCNYNLCPPCAFSNISVYDEENSDLPKIDIADLKVGLNKGMGNIYCNKIYVDKIYCLCGKCDGRCGPKDGCQCPLCECILAYNIYKYAYNFKCDCGNLYIKTNVLLLKKQQTLLKSIFGSSTLKCYKCLNESTDDFQTMYNCNKCNKSACQACIYKYNKYKELALPTLPITMNTLEKQIKEKIRKESIQNFSICKQNRIKLTKKKEGGKIILVYLKTLLGTIYDINIDENEFVWKLIEELKKLDNQFKDYNTVFIYKNKIMDNNDCLCDYGITNESIINAINK